MGSKVFATYITGSIDDHGIVIDLPCIIVEVKPRHPAGGEQEIVVATLAGYVFALGDWHISDKRQSSAAYKFMAQSGSSMAT